MAGPEAGGWCFLKSSTGYALISFPDDEIAAARFDEQKKRPRKVVIELPKPERLVHVGQSVKITTVAQNNLDCFRTSRSNTCFDKSMNKTTCLMNQNGSSVSLIRKCQKHATWLGFFFFFFLVISQKL